MQSIYDALPNDTDFSILKQLPGVSGINFAATGDGYTYHTDRDRADRVTIARAGEGRTGGARRGRWPRRARRRWHRIRVRPMYFSLLDRMAFVGSLRTAVVLGWIVVILGVLSWVATRSPPDRQWRCPQRAHDRAVGAHRVGRRARRAGGRGLAGSQRACRASPVVRGAVATVHVHDRDGRDGQLDGAAPRVAGAAGAEARWHAVRRLVRGAARVGRAAGARAALCAGRVVPGVGPAAVR